METTFSSEALVEYTTLYSRKDITQQRQYDCVRFEVFTAVTMKNGAFGMLRHLALVRTDVSEELGASFIRVTALLLVHRLLSP
jgi:hypothetical protein